MAWNALQTTSVSISRNGTVSVNCGMEFVSCRICKTWKGGMLESVKFRIESVFCRSPDSVKMGLSQTLILTEIGPCSVVIHFILMLNVFCPY